MSRSLTQRLPIELLIEALSFLNDPEECMAIESAIVGLTARNHDRSVLVHALLRERFHLSREFILRQPALPSSDPSLLQRADLSLSERLKCFVDLVVKRHGLEVVQPLMAHLLQLITHEEQTVFTINSFSASFVDYLPNHAILLMIAKVVQNGSDNPGHILQYISELEKIILFAKNIPSALIGVLLENLFLQLIANAPEKNICKEMEIFHKKVLETIIALLPRASLPAAYFSETILVLMEKSVRMMDNLDQAIDAIISAYLTSRTKDEIVATAEILLEKILSDREILFRRVVCKGITAFALHIPDTKKDKAITALLQYIPSQDDYAMHDAVKGIFLLADHLSQQQVALLVERLHPDMCAFNHMAVDCKCALCELHTVLIPRLPQEALTKCAENLLTIFQSRNYAFVTSVFIQFAPFLPQESLRTALKCFFNSLNGRREGIWINAIAAVRTHLSRYTNKSFVGELLKSITDNMSSRSKEVREMLCAYFHYTNDQAGKLSVVKKLLEYITDTSNPDIFINFGIAVYELTKNINISSASVPADLINTLLFTIRNIEIENLQIKMVAYNLLFRFSYCVPNKDVPEITKNFLGLSTDLRWYGSGICELTESFACRILANQRRLIQNKLMFLLKNINRSNSDKMERIFNAIVTVNTLNSSAAIPDAELFLIDGLNTKSQVIFSYYHRIIAAAVGFLSSYEIRKAAYFMASVISNKDEWFDNASDYKTNAITTLLKFFSQMTTQKIAEILTTLLTRRLHEEEKNLQKLLLTTEIVFHTVMLFPAVFPALLKNTALKNKYPFLRILYNLHQLVFPSIPNLGSQNNIQQKTNELNAVLLRYVTNDFVLHEAKLNSLRSAILLFIEAICKKERGLLDTIGRIVLGYENNYSTNTEAARRFLGYLSSEAAAGTRLILKETILSTSHHLLFSRKSPTKTGEVSKAFEQFMVQNLPH